MAGTSRLSSTLIRWGGLASILGGLLSIAYHFLSGAYPFQFGKADTDYLLEAIQGTGAAASILMLLAVRHLHVQSGRGYGRVGVVGFYLSLLGSASRTLMVVIVALIYLLADKQAVQDTQYLWGNLFLPAMIGSFLGTVLFGIASARAHVLPVWFGVVMALSFPIHGVANAPGIEMGYVASGLIAIVLGMTLWLKGTESLGQPSANAVSG